jgi:hypothetical protein
MHVNSISDRLIGRSGILSCISIRSGITLLIYHYLRIAETELSVLSKSKHVVPLRTGAGLEVNGSPVRQWNTIDAAESRERRNLALSCADGTGRSGTLVPWHRRATCLMWSTPKTVHPNQALTDTDTLRGAVCLMLISININDQKKKKPCNTFSTNTIRLWDDDSQMNRTINTKCINSSLYSQQLSILFNYCCWSDMIGKKQSLPKKFSLLCNTS